jgi:transposase-like protein
MVVRIAGTHMLPVRAVDDEGEVLEILVQRRRDKCAAVKLMRKLLRKQGFAPKTVTTDKLRSYSAEIPPPAWTLTIVQRRSSVRWHRRNRQRPYIRSDRRSVGCDGQTTSLRAAMLLEGLRPGPRQAAAIRYRWQGAASVPDSADQSSSRTISVN